MTDVLRRKLGATVVPKKSTGVTVDALVRKTMPRDADAVLSLELSVESFAIATTDCAELQKDIAPYELIYLLESSNGARGVAVLDAGLLSAVIEVQVAGRLSDQTPPERPPTRTDGIVAGEIVDRWLESAETATAQAGLEAAWPIAGFERAPVAISRREAELMLEPVEFRVIDISVLLGGGDRRGRLRLATPRSAPLIEQQENTTGERVRGHLPELSVEFRAILARLPVGMIDLSEFSDETFLRLPDGCLSHVRLETRSGKLIQKVRLGELDGQKAVRLSEKTTGAIGATQVAGLPTPAEELPAAMPPAAPELTAPTDLPDLPELPELPDANAGTPTDVPELPELPDLPELPEFPQ